MEHGFLFNTFIFLAAACLVVPIASRFRLGSILGYLAAGVIIGPFGFGFIGNAEQVMHFAEFGVIMMLFVIGLELEPTALWRMRRAIVGLGGLQVLLTAIAFTAIGLTFGYDWRISAAVGMALSLSSTALVMQLLEERNLTHTHVGETALSVMLFQDIAVIPILIFIPLLAASNVADPTAHASWISDYPGWLQAAVVAGVIACVVLSGRYLMHYLFDAIARTQLREVFTATSLMLVAGITLLMQAIGISPALGAFISGVVLANSEYKHTLETDIEPFKGLLLGLFFISIGMGMDFALFLQEPLLILGLVAGLIAVKAIILYALGSVFDLTPSHRIGFALGLSQGGEFAFVLFQFAGGLKILSPELQSMLTMVVALSMAVTPLLILYYHSRIVPRFMSMLPEREYDVVSTNNDIILAGYGRFGQIIGRFLMAQDVKLTILEKDPEQIDLLRKFGFKGYFGDASRAELLKSAGAAHAKILIIAIADVNVCLDMAQMARHEFPNLKIYARARNRRHAYELSKLGVHYFRRDTFDSALTMAQAIMVDTGKRESDMQYRAQQFMRHDEEALRKSFDFFDNEPELIEFARFNAEELERILQDDAQEEQAESRLVG